LRFHLLYKKEIIAIIEKNGLLIVTPVVNVVKFVLNEVHGFIRVGTLLRPVPCIKVWLCGKGVACDLFGK
jgi:hypothetical protein